MVSAIRRFRYSNRFRFDLTNLCMRDQWLPSDKAAYVDEAMLVADEATPVGEARFIVEATSD